MRALSVLLLLLLPARAAGVEDAQQPAEEKKPDQDKDAAPGPPTDTLPWPHYDKGFVLVPTLDPVKQPFRLVLNHVSELRYTNTLAVDRTFTDHLGNGHDVLRRNDIQVVRDVFYFSGFVLDPRLDFNLLLFTSTATLTVAVAGYVGFVFSKAFALRGGYFSMPSVRSLTGTFPFFHGQDRSMSNNYFRTGFTQGVWANGEPLPGWRYIAMIGNSLNTLNISAPTIDTHLSYSATVWYDRNEFGQYWNDYEYHDKPAVRLGTCFTYAPEDRLSDLDVATPEDKSIFLSDGILLFSTGALAPNVTVNLADYYLWSIDAGIKYRGLAFNAEFYQRWLNRLEADGPLPLTSMYDWGFEASLGYFVLRNKLEAYLRSSLVRGPFATAVEGAVGAAWYPFGTRQVWLNLEAILIKGSPFESAFYVYASGQTGLLVPLQFLLRF